MVITGLVFLLSGLAVTMMATMPMPVNQPMGESPAVTPSMWIEFAEQVMTFTVQLLSLDWTPTRVGIFLIVVGLVLEGAGVYAFLGK
ncbi:MAG: hypothetical protein D6803_07120 [Anaerolineae bacterium]|nr:MAG: hypothetical protein D6803_07120 [Anaerolineae bacterium]